MDANLRTQIYHNLNEKETDDLLDIWQNGDVDEWNAQAFDVVEEILRQRLGELPSQPVQRQITQILNKVDRHLKSGDLETALNACELAIQMQPESAVAYNYRGQIYDEMGQLENAIADYQTAIQLDPSLEDAWANMLSVEQDLETAFHNSPANQYFDQAIEYFYEDEPERALAACELGRETLPEIAFAHNYLGMLLEQLEQLEPAQEAYLKAIQLNPKFYSARINLANVRMRLEAEQYRQTTAAEDDPAAQIENGGSLAFETAGFENDEQAPETLLPQWIYLDEKAFLLRGWPGHRNRQGRFGLDPLETDFEYAHMQGVIARKLLDRQFRTHNLFYLLFMTFIGLIYCSPLLAIIPFLQGQGFAITLIMMNGLTVLAGLLILLNVWLSLMSIFSGEDAEHQETFF